MAWRRAFDAILDAFHEGAGCMSGDVDPLRSIIQGQAETAPFPFRAVVGALQPEQVCKTGADALLVTLGALMV